MRDNSVSIAKGITIALVVMVHFVCIDFIIRCILIFVLTLFFFMSGYCFKDKYLDDALAFIKKRFTGIYWPYLKWSLLFLLMHNVFYHLNIYSDEYGYGGKTSILYTTADFVKRAISVTTQMQGHEQLLGAYWFMKLLFIGSFIFYIALKVLKSKAWGALLLLALSVLLYSLPIKRLSEFPVIEEYTRQGWWIAYLIVGVAIPVIWTFYYHLFKDRLINNTFDKVHTR